MLLWALQLSVRRRTSHFSAFLPLLKCGSQSLNESHVIQAFSEVVITWQVLYVFKTPGTSVLPDCKWL
jgi:hypothetical protein